MTRPVRPFNGIAHCGDISWPDYEAKQYEWKANARLIAAAPDMLAALNEAEMAMSWAHPHLDCDPVTEERGVNEAHAEALAKVRATIAKATAS